MLLRRSNNHNHNNKNSTTPSLISKRKWATVRNGASAATCGGQCNRSLPRQVGIFVVIVCFILLVYSGHRHGHGYVTPSDLSMFNFVADDLVTVVEDEAQQQSRTQSSSLDRRKAAEHQDLNNPDISNNDQDCIFRNSPIYRKVFVYPNPGELGWEGDLLTEHGRNLTAMQWPWLSIDEQARRDAKRITTWIVRTCSTQPNCSFASL